jgi:serine/threonine-protein kinase
MPEHTPDNSIAERLRLALSGRYEVGERLGEGGMALVYDAMDVRHGRPVAVKVLRPELSAMLGADRFLREIQVTAKLQHPHILPLYDSGAAGGLLYYVMPLIQGESLRSRLDRERQLPVPEALTLTRAIASALDYAHRHGVLHRDIKPENILLHDGQPMLADFGIALAVRSAGSERLTGTGMSIGTPAYMSPEQIGGDRALDARSDIYSLGCVAYEMLAGAAPFSGPNLQALMAAVMTGEFRPLTEVRRTVPEAAARVVERALEPLPADRFATAAELSQALGIELNSGPVPSSRRPTLAARRRVYWLAGGLLAGGLLGFSGTRMFRPAESPTVRRWNVVLPDTALMSLPGGTLSVGPHASLAIAPAGDRLVYVTSRGGGMLAVRDMADGTVTTLTGTDGAYHPFFSPDGQWIGFFAGDLLRKVPVTGGNPVTLAQVNRVTGAMWMADNRIMVLQNEGFDLHWISASGTGSDSAVRLGVQFGTPGRLPVSGWVSGQFASGQLAMLSLKTGEELAVTRRGVLSLDSVRGEDLLFGSSPQWEPSGYLLYGAGDGVLMAMPFDPGARRVRGEPIPLLSGMRIEAGFGYAEFALADDGTLVYVPGNNQLYVNIAFAGPGGRFDTLPFPRAAYTQPRLSPDGTQLAVQARRAVGGWEVLLMNLATGVQRKVEVPGDYRTYPASWLPNGRDLMIGIWDPVRQINHGARIQSLETGKSTDIQLPGAAYMTVSPDGSQFVFNDWRTGNLFLRPLNGDTARIPIPARGYASSFSPDGRWVAWSGVDGSVAVSPAPPSGAIYQVTDQGNMPLWTPDGTGLIFRNAGKYYRVPVTTTGGFHAGRAELFAQGPFLSTFAWNHDIARDGRLLVLLNSPERTASTVGVITAVGDAIRRSSTASQGQR